MPHTERNVFRQGDRIISVESCPAVVEFSELLDATEVEPDELESRAPWQECEGLEHEATPPDEFDRPVCVERMRGYVYDSANSQRVVLTIDKEEPWGIYEFQRQRGASRQVAREASAAARRRTVEQLKEWYREGWTWWGVRCKFHVLGEEFEASVWGYDSEEYAESQRPEIAEQVAAQLEAAGFTVTGQPSGERRYTARQWATIVSAEGIREGLSPHAMTAAQWREEYRRNLNAQNWTE